MSAFQFGQNISLKIAKRPPANGPLRLVIAGDIAIRKCNEVLRRIAPATFLLPHDLVLRHEAFVTAFPFRRKSPPNTAIASNTKQAIAAIQNRIHSRTSFRENPQRRRAARTLEFVMTRRSGVDTRHVIVTLRSQCHTAVLSKWSSTWSPKTRRPGACPNNRSSRLRTASNPPFFSAHASPE